MKPRILLGAFLLYAGFFSASAGRLIAYFYTKQVFYLGLTYFLSSATLYLFALIPDRAHAEKRILIYLSGIIVFLSPLFLYFLYYIRPFTYYFSLIAIPGTIIVTLGAFILSRDTITPDPENVIISGRNRNIIQLLIFLSGYLPVLIIPLHTLVSVLLIFVTLLVVILLLITFIRIEDLTGIFLLVFLCLITSGFNWYFYYSSPPLKFFSEQHSYEDKVVFHSHTYRHELTLVQWKKYYWLFMDGLKNLSSVDDYLFYEPFIHPAVHLCDTCSRVLVLGGENGCAVRELLKYSYINRIDVIPYDTTYLNISRANPVFKKINNNSLTDQRVNVIKGNIDRFITRPDPVYDLIVIDLPDPKSLEYNQFYIRKFYRYCFKKLNDKGVLVTQAGSPFYAPRAYVAIGNTVRDAGFSVIPIHNQVMTLSEWGWMIGVKNQNIEIAMNILLRTKFRGIRTKWLDREAVKLITSFGKSPDFDDTVSVNTLDNPVVFNYYRESMKAVEGP